MEATTHHYRNGGGPTLCAMGHRRDGELMCYCDDDDYAPDHRETPEELEAEYAASMAAGRALNR